MSEYIFVDWDGLVYYDQKIKDYVDKKTDQVESVVFEEDLIVNNPVGEFVAGESVKNLTLKSILIKLLSLSKASSNIEEVIDNQIPLYSGLDGSMLSHNFKQLDENSNPNDIGFYVIKNETGIESAGYQLSTPQIFDNDVLVICIPSNVTVTKIWQYDNGITDSWNVVSILAEDDSYFRVRGTVSKDVDGKDVQYTEYVWNSAAQGGGIVTPCNWRFEIKL